MHRLDIFQSMWGMERRAPDGCEWSATEALKMIIEAGFSGIDILALEGYMAQKTPAILEVLPDTELDLIITAFPTSRNGLETALELADKWRSRVRYINLVPAVMPFDLNECADTIRHWLAKGEAAAVPIYVETHRMSMTQDLLFTLQLMDAVPEMQMVADLSHCMVNQEWTFPPLTAEQEGLINRVLERSEGIQGRIASAQQVQIQPAFAQHKPWVGIFREWWRRGFIHWRQRHAHSPDDRLVFLVELGPPPYAITGADGFELSDRWQESLLIKRWAEEIWLAVDRAVLQETPHRD